MPRPTLAQLSLPPRARKTTPTRKQLQPDGVRLYYFAQIRALMAKAHAMVMEQVLPLVLELAPTQEAARVDGVRTDAPESAASKELRARIKAVSKEFMAKNMGPVKLAALTTEVAKRTSDMNRDQLFNQIKDTIGIDPLIGDAGLQDAAAKFTAENVSLIRSVPERYFGALEEDIAVGVREGQRATTIAKQMETDYGTSESDARRIANDQVGKFYGELNDTRLQDLGVESAEWSTVHDARVRHSHEDLDGKDYQLGEGLVDTQTGERVIPGEAINCRCQGMPDLSALLG